MSKKLLIWVKRFSITKLKRPLDVVGNEEQQAVIDLEYLASWGFLIANGMKQKNRETII